MTSALLADFPVESAVDAAWHIDAKDRDPRGEEKRQAAFIRDMRLVCPSVRIFSVPNAGRRSVWEAGKRQREGMKKGVPDLVATWKGGVAFLEFKGARDMPTPDQREWLNALYDQGQHVGVFRQEASAIRWLVARGAPCLVRGL